MKTKPPNTAHTMIASKMPPWTKLHAKRPTISKMFTDQPEYEDEDTGMPDPI